MQQILHIRNDKYAHTFTNEENNRTKLSSKDSILVYQNMLYIHCSTQDQGRCNVYKLCASKMKTAQDYSYVQISAMRFSTYIHVVVFYIHRAARNVLFYNEQLIQRERKNSVTGWARTNNLSVNSRTNCATETTEGTGNNKRLFL